MNSYLYFICIHSFSGEEERQDVFLLYQKLGCYKDDSKRHDLPNPVQVKAVTQEECVRACALQDKGFAYFGLQNGKDCFCGKNYGKYGKVDNKLCSRTCEGNPMEGCGGDGANQIFFFGLGTYNAISILSIGLDLTCPNGSYKTSAYLAVSRTIF